MTEKASSGDVLRALAEEALGHGVHPDRERVLRDYVGEGDEPTDDRTAEGQGAGGEGKPLTERDRTGQVDRERVAGEPREGDDTSPTTSPEASSDAPKRKAGK